MGTDAIPPRAGGLPTRLVLGPALRAQSDRRLVRLVREGYEGAFEEIVRRYRRPLGRFAASIVGGRHEDVTQDSFRKALEALRRGDAEIELRPWLYRIVRNTALNDLRDRPPAAAELADDLVAGTRSAAAEAEAREEVAELVEHLRALPENQRAALLMRELDGMGHDEIGAALGISKGAARQAIARGRAAVRSGFGALLPLPWLRSLLDGGAPVEAGVGTGALAGAGATAIGAGGAGALKIGLATVVVAGSLGAGVAIDHGGAGHHASAAAQTPSPSTPPAPPPPSERSQLAVTITENCERTAARRLKTWPTTPAATIGPAAEAARTATIDAVGRTGGATMAATRTIDMGRPSAPTSRTRASTAGVTTKTWIGAAAARVRAPAAKIPPATPAPTPATEVGGMAGRPGVRAAAGAPAMAPVVATTDVGRRRAGRWLRVGGRLALIGRRPRFRDDGESTCRNRIHVGPGIFLRRAGPVLVVLRRLRVVGLFLRIRRLARRPDLRLSGRPSTSSTEPPTAVDDSSGSGGGGDSSGGPGSSGDSEIHP